MSVENQVAIVNNLAVEQVHGRANIKPAIVVEPKPGNKYDLQISGNSAIVPEVPSVVTTAFIKGDAVIVKCPLGSECTRQIVSASSFSIPEETVFEFSTKPKERPSVKKFLHVYYNSSDNMYRKHYISYFSVYSETPILYSWCVAPGFKGSDRVYAPYGHGIRKFDLAGNLIAEKSSFPLP